MAKIDEEQFTTKYQGKISTLQKRIDNLELLKKQRHAWSSQLFLVSGRAKKKHTAYVSVYASLDLSPVTLPVDQKFIDNVIATLNTRIEKGEHEVAEAIRELAAQPRRAR